jgi:hypothetical protein
MVVKSEAAVNDGDHLFFVAARGTMWSMRRRGPRRWACCRADFDLDGCRNQSVTAEIGPFQGTPRQNHAQTARLR